LGQKFRTVDALRVILFFATWRRVHGVWVGLAVFFILWMNTPLPEVREKGPW
jgi:hypothetical protein